MISPVNTDFINDRLKVWQQLYQKYHKEHFNSETTDVFYKDEAHQIKVSDAPSVLAKKLGFKNCFGCKINNKVTDLWRPIDNLSTKLNVEFINFDTDEGKKMFWHSTAHILGQALEIKYGCHLSVGPALTPVTVGDSLVNGGFYYEGSLDDSLSISLTDLVELETIMNSIIRQNQIFERLTVTKEEALQLFAYNKYKCTIIANKVPDGESCTVYKCGPFIDLCKGPHLSSTGIVRAVKLTSVSSSYFLGDAKNDSLQRVYGISFPDKNELKHYLNRIEEIKKRDHRVIGERQKLFFFHDISPGSCYFLPHGTRIYNRLLNFIQSEYWKRGFEQVMTPIACKKDLWITSGHWDKYKDNMFTFECDDSNKVGKEEKEEKDVYGLCAMNCPKHCIMFKHTSKSYKELPIRYADFGALHRNELKGALTGLTRVRCFHQDDAHIFCRRSQIKEEIDNCLDFLTSVYGVFGFTFSLELSTRPDDYIGDLNMWDIAEKQLAESLDSYSKEWTLGIKNGAFYGPKIDIQIKDAIGRSHQCATIQLDFNLPERFNLEFVNENGEKERPVMIHRAIYGSFERFIAILIEHCAGRWPFWISPRQVIVLPISEKFRDYANHIRNIIHSVGYYVDVDFSDRTIDKRVREAQIEQYNYIIVVGQIEETNNTVNIRYRDNKNKVEMSVEKLLEELCDLMKNKI